MRAQIDCVVMAVVNVGSSLVAARLLLQEQAAIAVNNAGHQRNRCPRGRIGSVLRVADRHVLVP